VLVFVINFALPLKKKTEDIMQVNLIFKLIWLNDNDTHQNSMKPDNNSINIRVD